MSLLSFRALGFYLLKQNFIPVPKALELNAEGDSWDGTTGDDFRKYDDMELTEDDHETLLEEIEMGFENFPADTLRNAKASAVSQINWFGIDNAHREYDADSDNIIRFKVESNMNTDTIMATDLGEITKL